MVRPGISVVRGRLSKIVETGPHELSHSPGIILFKGKVYVRHIGPPAGIQVVGRALMVRIHCSETLLGRELVHSPRAHCRCRLRPEDKAVGQVPVGLQISESAVVESRNVNECRKSVVQHTGHLVHSAGARPGRVFAVAYILKETRHLVALRITLCRDLVAYAPKCHTRGIAPAAKHPHHIPLCPTYSGNIGLLIEETVISVLTFGNIPFIERLYHHHKAHFLTQLHQFRCRHIVGSTDGIAAHIL